jgi:hypothetical protein
MREPSSSSFVCPGREIPWHIPTVEVVDDLELCLGPLVGPVAVVKAVAVPDEPESHLSLLDSTDQNLENRGKGQLSPFPSQSFSKGIRIRRQAVIAMALAEGSQPLTRR